MLPRVLYRYELDLHRVLDLTDEQIRQLVGLTEGVLTGDDWSLCQQLGTEAYASGDQAIRTFSATGVDTMLVVFTELLGPASSTRSRLSGGTISPTSPDCGLAQRIPKRDQELGVTTQAAGVTGRRRRRAAGLACRW